ncbi:MAG: S1C family serine protease [bacterium]
MRLSIFRRKRKDELPIGRNGFISAVIIGALFGLAAGVVGMLMTVAYLPSVVGSTVSGYASPIEPVVIRARLSSDMVVRGLSGPTALIYRGVDVGEAVLPSTAVGGGSVLTSDGWLLTHESVLRTAGSTSGRGVKVLVSGRAYDVERVTVDPFTGAAFVKIGGSGLPVVSIGTRGGDLSVGDSVVSFDYLGGLRTAVVTAWSGVPSADVAGLHRSSEAVQRVALIGGSDGFLVGGGVFGTNGELAGVYLGGAEPGSRILPIDSFVRQVSDVLRGNGIVRPYLGVRYVDLTEQPGFGTPSRGALLSSYGRFPAVARQSPAAVAGLLEGDVILAVDGETVTANRTLPELLADYSPGDSVSLTVERGPEQLELEVALGQMPTP